MRSLIDPRAWWGLLRLLHYHNYSHVTPRREVSFGLGVRLAPNVSLANGERIAIGDRTHVGAHSSLWAGRREGRIDIGEDCLLGPEVFVTAANYRTDPGTPVWRQDTVEDDVTIGSGVWLGARVMVLPGVDIGDGAVVGAGSVVTRSLPSNAIAVGNPARVIGSRVGRSHSAKAA